MPAHRCEMRGVSPISSPRNRSSDAWMPGVVSSTSRELVEDRDVAEAPEEHAAVRQLLPVIEALTRVMRLVVEDAVERLAHDHLAARRPDRVRQLGDETVAIAIGGDDHLLGIECRYVVDPIVLPDLSAGFRRERGEAPHPARRLQGTVARVQDPSLEAARQHARQIVDPLRIDSVLAHRLVLAVGSARAPHRLQRGGSCLGGAMRLRRAPPCGRVLFRSSSTCRAPVPGHTYLAQRRTATRRRGGRSRRCGRSRLRQRRVRRVRARASRPRRDEARQRNP